MSRIVKTGTAISAPPTTGRSRAYQPFGILKFRGAASTGFRAPTLVEEYGANVFGAVRHDERSGMRNGRLYDGILQIKLQLARPWLYGGNPNLKPETSQNFDLGFVVQPMSNSTSRWITTESTSRTDQQLPGSTIYANPTTFTADYVLNTTLGRSLRRLIPDCVCRPSKAPTCGYIIQNVPKHREGIVTDGVDVSANYLIDSDFGKFRIGMEGTFVTGFGFRSIRAAPSSVWLDNSIRAISRSFVGSTS